MSQAQPVETIGFEAVETYAAATCPKELRVTAGPPATGPSDDRLVAAGDYGRTSGIRAVLELLEVAPDLDAVFAANDVDG